MDPNLLLELSNSRCIGPLPYHPTNNGYGSDWYCYRPVNPEVGGDGPSCRVIKTGRREVEKAHAENSLPSEVSKDFALGENGTKSTEMYVPGRKIKVRIEIVFMAALSFWAALPMRTATALSY